MPTSLSFHLPSAAAPSLVFSAGSVLQKHEEPPRGTVLAPGASCVHIRADTQFT